MEVIEHGEDLFHDICNVQLGNHLSRLYDIIDHAPTFLEVHDDEKITGFFICIKDVY